MSAEEENTELIDSQGQHRHAYGFELPYGMDLGSFQIPTLGNVIKKLQLHLDILEETISARDHQKLQRLTENTIPNKFNLIESIIEETQELMIDNESSIQQVKAWNSETRGIVKNTLNSF